MFEDDAKLVSEELLTISGGALQCLPASRALLDFYEALGIPARPLVVRPIIFGKTDGIDWLEVNKTVPLVALFKTAEESPDANHALELTLPSGPVTVPYRSLGHTHGAEALGSYAPDGSWNGHLAVVVENQMIDLTLGQINSATFGIQFEPPYAVLETDPQFLSGQGPYIGVQDGMLVIYRAYPDEKTYEQSKSWTDPRFREQLKEVGVRAAAKRK
jgi:hypothetical protein